MLALSIVAPHGANIASGKKTLEVRSWLPPSLPIRDLLIVENGRYLSADHPVDPAGRAVALVDIEEAHEWQPDEVLAAGLLCMAAVQRASCGRWARGAGAEEVV
ncbi:ASCH domain-containing protein [Aeromonas dhakensis]|uniref:ASCH domain-containing protein n=1 Tax=Aeromonas dhakensis TaxID=196024 RepID=UPI00398693EC